MVTPEDFERRGSQDPSTLELRDKMILGQRTLLQMLREMGIVDMLEGKTSPAKLSIPSTRQEEEYEREKMRMTIAEMRKRPPSTMNAQVREGVAAMIDAEGRQEWVGRVLPPRQHGDETFDLTLRIVLTNYPAARRRWGPALKEVRLEYSPEGLLEIWGRTQTFRGIATIGLSNIGAITIGLVEAFSDPQIQNTSIKEQFLKRRFPMPSAA